MRVLCYTLFRSAIMCRSCIWITLAVLLCTCQEYYTDPDIRTRNEYLVVEGTITTEPGPYLVRISKTWPYNRSGDQVQDTTQISGAVVVISDNSGEVDTCLESGPGLYYTTGIRGETGKSYQLDIRMPDGTDYRSEPCTMADPAGFDSVYAEAGSRTVLESNGTGGYYEKIQEGLFLYVDVTAPATEYYFKIETHVVKETTHLEWPSGRTSPPGSRPPQSISVFCWELSTLENDDDLVSSLTGSAEMIQKRNAGFVTPDIFSITDATTDPSYLVGVFVNSTISALPKRIFEIFSQLDKQSDPSNSLFDPIPTRIGSNISCLNDPDRLVLGYFSASAISRRMRFFRLKNNEVEVTDIGPSYPLPVTEDCTMSVAPDFWIGP